MKKILIVFLIVLIFSGCNKSEKMNKTVINVGFFPNITHAQALLGQNGKFDDGTGCKIEWKKFNAGSTEIEAMMAKELDIAYVGPGPAINGYIKTNGEIKIIAGVCEGGAMLVSRKELKIKTPAELKGLKIAVPQFGNTQHIVLKKLMEENGLKESTKGGNVDIIQAENPDIGMLFDKKAVDAAFVPEPWASKLVMENGANIVMDYDKFWNNGKYPVTVIIARTDFIKKNPELIKKFINTHKELTNFANENREITKERVNGELKRITGKEIAKNVIDSAFSRVIFSSEIDKNAVIEMSEIMKSMGNIKKESKVDGIFENIK